MKFITIVSDTNHPGLTLLKESCEYHGLYLDVLFCNYTSHRMKIEILREYLNTLNSDELILFTDGYDTIMLAGEEEILKKYNAFKGSILFSAESNCYPDSSLKSSYPNIQNSHYCFLNSGNFIGKVNEIIESIDQDIELSPDFYLDDQYFWTKRYLKNTTYISLDFFCEIFCTLSPEKGGEGFTSKDPSTFPPYITEMNRWFGNTFSISDGRLYNLGTKSQPCVLHFNGKSKCVINHGIISDLFTKMLPSYTHLKENYLYGLSNPKFVNEYIKYINQYA